MTVPAAVFDAAGLPPTADRTLSFLGLIRALHATTEPFRDEEAHLRRAVTQALNQPGGEVVTLPLPLPPAVFEPLFRERNSSPKAFGSTLLRERRAALLYYGAMALDAETRAFLAARPELTRETVRNHAGIVATFGRSMRIANGRVIVPGGDAAAPLWEAIVGERVTAPEEFVRRLWTSHDGRLAYMFDTIAHLDAPRQRFALGLWVPEAARLDRLRVVQRAFTGIDREWSFANSPFGRPRHDAALLLRVVPVDGNGAPVGLVWRGVWRAAFDGTSLPSNPRRKFRRILRDGSIDAAWLVEEIILVPPPARRERFEMYAFGTRRFVNPDAADAPDIVLTLRAFARYPAMVLALERMGVGSPAVYVDLARAAGRVESIGSVRRGNMALAQFQGALAIAGRAARAGRVNGAALESLLSSLARVEMENERYAGRMATWIADTLVPALGVKPEDTGTDFRLKPEATDTVASTGLVASGFSRKNDIERTLLIAMADRSPDGDGKPFEWEGASYRVDVTAGDLARFEQVRAKQGGPRLDDVLAREARREGNGATGENDRLLADVLLGLVYAPHQGDPAELFPAAADLFRRHDFALDRIGLTSAARRRAPWERPRIADAAGQQLRVSGSLLGLDLALARNAVRRLTTDRMPERPRLNQNDREAVMETAAQLNPRDLTDTQMRAIAEGLARGRDRIAAVRTDGAALDALASDAGVSEIRRQVLSWNVERHADDIEDVFTLTEVLRLGSGDIPGIDAWGMTNEPLTGCYCLAFPDAIAWEHFAGRPGAGQIAARLPDLALRLAELMVEIGAPAAVLPATYSYAAQDFADEAPVIHTGDGDALVQQARALTRIRVEDYLAAVAARGPLRPESR